MVGMVADAVINSALEPPPPLFFLPAPQQHDQLSFLAVRAAGDPLAVARSLREELANADPGVVWPRWQTLEERRRDGLRGRMAVSYLVMTLAAVALLLASLGVGASLAHLVALRRREIAIRMALGADRTQVVRSILHDAWRVAAVGGLGAIVILALLQAVPLVRSNLGELWDGWALAASIGAAGLAATLGAWRPARSATRIEPQRLLTAE